MYLFAYIFVIVFLGALILLLFMCFLYHLFWNSYKISVILKCIVCIDWEKCLSKILIYFHVEETKFLENAWTTSILLLLVTLLICEFGKKDLVISLLSDLPRVNLFSDTLRHTVNIVVLTESVLRGSVSPATG